MNDKYYVMTIEPCTYPDSTTEYLHVDHPFDDLEAAKAWAISEQGEGHQTIYCCHDNVLKPILVREPYGITWEEWD